MHRRGVFTLPLIMALRGSLHANPANGDPRKEKLFSMFIAPCCWRENLLIHHSPKADEMRAEIEKLVATGRTDDEIKKSFVDSYSLRILAMPEGARGQWLSWGPLAAVSAGLGIVVLFVSRSLRRAQQPAPAGSLTANLPDLPDEGWD
jgi:cytochrome c-type biogenesis protein CcmH/NrfF